MGMGFAPTWLRQVSPLLHKTTLTTDHTGMQNDHCLLVFSVIYFFSYKIWILLTKIKPSLQSCFLFGHEAFLG